MRTSRWKAKQGQTERYLRTERYFKKNKKSASHQVREALFLFKQISSVAQFREFFSQTWDTFLQAGLLIGEAFLFIQENRMVVVDYLELFSKIYNSGFGRVQALPKPEGAYGNQVFGRQGAEQTGQANKKRNKLKTHETTSSIEGACGEA